MKVDPSVLRARATRVALTALLAALSATWLVPLAMMLINAMKSKEEYLSSFEPWTLPANPGEFLTNLKEAWVSAGLGPGFGASLSYGVLGSAIAIACAALGAYSIARLGLPGRKFWFAVAFAGMSFPLQMFLIPLFRMYLTLGMYDTYLGMVLFYAAISVPFCLFVLRGYFATVPREYHEAARIDGASEFRVLRSVYLPLAKSSIAVLFLFQFTWIWNDLVFGLVLSASDGVRPIAASLAAIQDQFSTSGPTVTLAGAVVASAPTIILFLALARVMTRGLTMTTGVRS